MSYSRNGAIGGGGSGGGGISGSGAAGQVTLWNGPTSITGDAGCTWTGTGPTFKLSAPFFLAGDGDTATPVFAQASFPGTGIGFNAFGTTLNFFTADTLRAQLGAGYFQLFGASPMLYFGTDTVANDGAGGWTFGTLGGGANGTIRTGTLSGATVRRDDPTGAAFISSSVSELITLSTSGTTTDSSADLLPVGAIIDGVACRVIQAITVATDWSLGDATTAARFASANSTLTVGTTSIGLNQWKGGVSTDAAGPVQVAAAKLRITTTGTPGAGQVRCVVFYRTLTPPPS